MPTNLSTPPAPVRKVFAEAMPNAQRLWKTYILPPLTTGSVIKPLKQPL